MAGLWEYTAHDIAAHARVATATVTGKVLHTAGEPGYSKTAYEEDFAFRTAEGRRVEGKTRLSADAWERIKPGYTFQVTYAAGKPATYQIGTDTSTTVSDCVFLAVLAIWLVFLRLTIRTRHRQPSPRIAPAGAADTATNAPRPDVAKPSINGPVRMGGAALTIVGAIFLLIGIVNLVGQGAFRTQGKAATAIVLTRSTVIGRNGTNYPLGVRFTTDEGQSIETSVGVDYATMTSLREHLPVKIIYAPEHPEQIRLASDDLFTTFVFLWAVSALGGILAIGGAVMLSFGVLDARRERLLHSER